MTAELKHAADGVPDDGTSEVSHVHFLSDIRAGEVHDHPDLLSLWRRWSILPGKKATCGTVSGTWCQRNSVTFYRTFYGMSRQWSDKTQIPCSHHAYLDELGDALVDERRAKANVDVSLRRHSCGVD